MSDGLDIPGFLRRAEPQGPHDITQQCSKCGDAAEFGYKIEGAMQWFCDKHKISQNYADARLPKASESKQATNVKDELAQHAKAIKAAGTRVISDVIDIGRHLTEAKDLCGHGNWLPWLEHEFGWSDDTALNFMRVYGLASNTERVRNLDHLPLSGLYLLAQPSTPEKARQQIFDLAESGERVSVAQVKQTIAKARKPPSSKPTRLFYGPVGKGMGLIPDPRPNHKQIAAGLTLAKQMSLATLDQFIVGLRQIRREKKRHA